MRQSSSCPRFVASVIIATLTVTLPAWQPSSIAFEAPIATVTRRTGDVTLEIPGDQPRNAVRGETLAGGDTLRTGPLSSAQAALSDESFVNLGPDTSVRINQYAFDAEQDRRTAIIQVLAGKARFLVIRMRSPDSSFRVESENALADLNGTGDFIMQVNGGETVAIVLGGAADIRNRSLLTVGQLHLNANQRVSVLEKRAPASPQIVTRQERESLLSELR